MIQALRPFYPGTTKRFSISCKINGVPQDISADVLTFRAKVNRDDPDTSAIITSVADVASLGTNGIGIFNLTPAVTAVLLEKDNYYYDIVWERGTNEYVANTGTFRTLERISDI